MPKQKPIQHRINDFNIGMNPNIYGTGVSRMEHFDTVTGQARPYRALVASTMDDTGYALNKITNFTRGYDKDGAANGLWALGQIFDDPNYYAALLYWTSTDTWNALKSFGIAYTSVAQVLHYYHGAIYGLTAGTHIWKIVPGATSGATSLALTHAALTYSTYCRPITHSKDDLMYLGVDNKIYSFNGTTATLGLTLPTDFVITSISENGEFLEIIGYNVKTGQSMAYMWDRDSSLATVTQNYDLMNDFPLHAFNLGGVQFVITKTNTTTNPVATPTAYYLNIKYVTGDRVKTFNQFRFYELQAEQRGCFVYNDKAYFSALVKFNSADSYHFVIFEVNEKGGLRIAQNMGVADAGSVSYLPTDIIIDGEGFWIAGSGNGQWNTSSAYSTTAGQVPFLETTKYRSEEMTESLDFLGATVRFEPLPSGASVVLKTRADEATAWTTIATWDTDNAVRGSINKAGCTTAISRSKERQFRIESLGGATITGFQADIEGVNNENYG